MKRTGAAPAPDQTIDADPGPPDDVVDAPDTEITEDLHRYAAADLVDGSSVAEVVSAMTARGLSEVDAAMLAAEIFADPVFDVARSEMQRRRKLESVLAMQEQMKRLATPNADVDRRSGLSREEFLSDYYARNEAVILDDVCADWRACAVWSAEYLVERLGDVPVEVMADRDSNPDYEAQGAFHRQTMPYAEYARRIADLDWSNDLYLVANNKLLQTEAARVLWDDFELDPRYMRPRIARKRTFFWHGPAGTVTPLHHDVMNVMFHQVVGWKRFTLVPAAETAFVYNTHGVFSEVDPKAPNPERHPKFAGAHPRHVSVGPGEALFVPAGWWHHVEALEPSISVSSTAFAYPNQIEWFSPDAPR